MSEVWQVSMNMPAEHAFIFSEVMEPFLDSTSIFELEGTRMWELNGFISRSRQERISRKLLLAFVCN